MITDHNEHLKILQSLRVALVHDWLTGMRGGEKCLEVFCEIFPQADIYTLLHLKGSVSPIIEGHPIQTSWIEHLPWVEQKYRNYLPLFPRAIESFFLKGYDLILSSSHCVAKGIRFDPNTLHISYLHTPMRYVWDMYDIYFGKESDAGWTARAIMPAIRPFLQKWDVRSNDRVHYFLANSEHVHRRIKRIYNRQAEVIPPPVDTQTFEIFPKPHNYYLLVSALAPYKRVDLAVRAFNRMGKPLILVGTGPLAASLKKESGRNISWLGWQSSEELKKLYGECLAFFFQGKKMPG